jgi:DMSO/TMAO reductase YedYZ molybdopterin-dependent catalytic subunit
MRRLHDVRIGALAGFATTAALTGILYLLSQLQVLSFIPLDIAEAINHLTPGQIATQGIETLGPTAKILVEITGLLIFLGAGTVIGALVARRGAYTTTSNGLSVGLVVLLLTVLAQFFAGRFPDVITLGATAVVLFGWGLLLMFVLRRALVPEIETETATAPVAAEADRRAFLRRSGGILLMVAVGSSAIGELLRRASDEQLAQAIASGGAASLPGASLPQPTMTVPEPGAGAGVVADPSFVPGIGVRPELTAADRLYVVATTTRSPRVDASTWKLVVKGMVDHPLTLSYDDLRALPRLDQTSTLTCISNEVGGHLVGNMTWSGTRLRDLLQKAGVQSGAVDVVLKSVEGYTDSIPVERAMLAQNLIAYGMNGAALPVDHGFPARLIVPGIYGMKNVKWLGEIEVVGEDYQGFWEERGWSDTAIIKTQSTLDTGNPDLGNDDHVKLENGKVVLGGYAFAGERGISAVEVQIDGGAWQPAQLKQPTSSLTWREWRYEWPATPGLHTAIVRATDGAGQLQTADLADPHPDGASGWHTLQLAVA